MSISKIAYLLCIALLVAGGLLYYPKWKQSRTEATLSWDVSGYYYYLPAFLIYHDAKQLTWHDDILNKYYPAPGDQAYRHESGNMVMKYSSGLALQYLPFFLVAELITPLTKYPADGFSRPYQLAISLGSLLVAFIGLWLLRLALRRYFNDTVVAIVLFTIVFGTNYLDYAAINGAMTHNYLFTWYAALILLSDRYWKSQSLGLAIAIGAAAGLMALTRPTEAIAILIPLLWRVGSIKDLRERFHVMRQRWLHVLAAAGVFACVGMIQVGYWKYATGDWIVYSYQDQGFSWFHPHILNGMFSYRAGWLVYTPVMAFALIGFIGLWRKDRRLWLPVFVISVVYMYLTWAWDIWWYGGSLGQRSMVQLYPVLAFPLAACMENLWKSKVLRVVVSIVLLCCVYYNLWLTHQAHRGGLLRAGEMNKAYFNKIFLRYHVPDEAQFLLDNQEKFESTEHGKEITKVTFEDQDMSSCPIPPISGNASVCLFSQHEFSPVTKFEIPEHTQWLRATATFRCLQKEWDVWKMAQFRLHLMEGDQITRTNVIRVFRVLQDGGTGRFSVDLHIPRHANYTQAAVDLWNAGSDKPIAMDDLEIIAF